jgi:hypothetical protein
MESQRGVPRMKLKQEDKDVITGIILFIISLLIYTQIIKIRWGSKVFLTSAVLLPLNLNILFSILSLALIFTGIRRGGRLDFKNVGAAIKAGIRTNEFRIVLTAMLATALFIFVGVPYIGFFISGGIFMFCILFFYVKHLKKVYSILITAAVLAAIYGIFVLLFKIPLR